LGRRKRRKVIRKVKKKIPTIFICPRCGRYSVSVNVEEDEVIVSCGICELSFIFLYDPVFQPIDYYGKFVDKYYESIG